MVVHKNTVRSVTKIVCNHRFIAVKLQAKPISILDTARIHAIIEIWR
jgi:adenosine/AMP kinase